MMPVVAEDESFTPCKRFVSNGPSAAGTGGAAGRMMDVERSVCDEYAESRLFPNKSQTEV